MQSLSWRSAAAVLAFGAAARHIGHHHKEDGCLGGDSNNGTLPVQPATATPTGERQQSVEDWLKGFARTDETQHSTPKLSPVATSRYNYLVDRMPKELKDSVLEARGGIQEAATPDKLSSYERRMVMERFTLAATARMSSRISDAMNEDPRGAQRLGVNPMGHDENKHASNLLDTAMTGSLGSIAESGGAGGGGIEEEGVNSWHSASSVLLDVSIPPFIRDEILEEIVAARGRRAAGGGAASIHDMTIEEIRRQQEDLIADSENDNNKTGEGEPHSSAVLDPESHRNLQETFSKPFVVPCGRRPNSLLYGEECDLGNPGKYHEVGKQLKVAKVSDFLSASRTSPSPHPDDSNQTGARFLEEAGILWSDEATIDELMRPPVPKDSQQLRRRSGEVPHEENRVIDFSDLKPIVD